MVIISLSLFLISLFQTAITYQDYNGIDKATGLHLLLIGSTAILGGGLLEWIVWLANPLSLLAIIFFFQKRLESRMASKTAMFLSLSFMFWRHILISENGRQAEILTKNLGYWLWLTSIIMLTYGIHKYLKPLIPSNKLDNNNVQDNFQETIQENNSEVTIQIDIEEVNEFKIKYRNKTKEKLTDLAKDKRFILAARTAAQELIDERKESLL